MNAVEVNRLRKALNLTQAHFGQLFGVHPMTVSKWERGILAPNEYQLSLMAEFKKAARDRQVKDRLVGVLIGAGIAAAIFLLLNATRK
jgi:transcriptional regulator with XRE-family HTH domain